MNVKICYQTHCLYIQRQRKIKQEGKPQARYNFHLQSSLPLYIYIVEASRAAAANTWSQTGSWSLICSKSPFVPYEPPGHMAQGRRTSPEAPEAIPLYGSMDLT